MSALAKFGTDQALGFLVGIGFLVVIQPTTPGGGLLLVLIALAIVNVTMQIIRLCLRWLKKDDGSSAIKIFLTYASEDRTIAESITFSLRERGYTSFSIATTFHQVKASTSKSNAPSTIAASSFSSLVLIQWRMVATRLPS
jgi:hypothetical protein